MCSCPGEYVRIDSHHMVRHVEDGHWGSWKLEPRRTIAVLDRTYGGRDNWEWRLLYAWKSHEET
jgi:hypothetical protein